MPLHLLLGHYYQIAALCVCLLVAQHAEAGVGVLSLLGPGRMDHVSNIYVYP